MTDQSRDPVTRADITGLRHDTQDLKDSVDTFATKAQVADVKKLAKRANINSFIGAGAVVLVAVVAFYGWHSNSATLDRIATGTHDRRAADCHAMDDVGSAIKAGVQVLQSPGATAEQQARIDQFIVQYGQAVDAAISTAKVRKGYSTDCKVIGSPPSTGG